MQGAPASVAECGRMTDRFETLAVHAGAEPDPHTGAVVPAIQMSTTFKQDGVGGLRGGYEYGRSGNPTRLALEKAIAEIGAEPSAVPSTSPSPAPTATS